MKFETLLRRMQCSALLIVLVLPSLAKAMDLPTAVSKTLENSPKLQLYPYHVRALEGDAIQAGLKPNPILHVDLENVLGTGDSRFLAGSELTLSLSQLIELGDKQDKRVTIVDRRSAALHYNYQVTRLDVVAEMMRDFYNTLRLQHLIDWNQAHIESEKSALTVISRQAKAGAVGQADVMRMKLRLTRSEVKQDELSEQHQHSLKVLANHWADDPEFTQIKGDLAQLPSLPTKLRLAEAIQHTPDYLLAQSETRIKQAQLSLAQAESRANLTLGAGIRRMEDSDDSAFVFNFSMPLQWHNHNQGNIAAAQAEYETRQANQTLLMNQLKLTLSQIHLAMNNRLNQIDRLETELYPMANRLLAEIKQGYQLGQYNVVQWVDAQDELFTIQREVIESQHAVHLQLLELERLSGNSLVNDVITPDHKD